MSDYVRYKGKIEKLDFIPEEEIKLYLISKMTDKEYKEYQNHKKDGIEYDNNYEMLSWFDDLKERFIIVDGILFRVLEKKRMGAEMDIYDSNWNEDGTIDFHVMYYNGGCSLDEAIAEAIKG